MARYTFAGDESSTALAETALGNDRRFLKFSGASLTAWDAETGGTQLTDLLLDSAPVTAIPVGPDGQVPQFEGPDGVTSLWLDGGAGRRLFLAIDVDIVEQAAAHEAAAAGYALDAQNSADAAAGVVAGALQASNNLSDVASVSTARANLGAAASARTITAGSGLTGGGDLSADRTLAANIGTTAGTLAAGDDARITGAAQKSANLSDLASTSTARTNLGAQASDAKLSALAGLSPAADRLPYFTGASAMALATLTSFIRTLLDDADAATARATLFAMSTFGGGQEDVAAALTGSGTKTLDASTASIFRINSMTGAITVAFSNITNSKAVTLTLIVTQDATLRTFTWPAAVKWSGGTTPTMAASKTYIFNFFTIDGGTTIYGWQGGNFT